MNEFGIWNIKIETPNHHKNPVLLAGSFDKSSTLICTLTTFFVSCKESLSPYINHFLSADTIVPNYANPQSLNRYSYVLNNPLRYTDPTGHAVRGDTDEAGCSFKKGVSCIINMYGGYGDSDGMMDSIGHYHRRNKDYNPVTDPGLSLEQQALVSIAIFQADQEDASKLPNIRDRAKAAFEGTPEGVAVIIMVGVIFGPKTNMAPDEGGGGWSTGRGPSNAREWGAWNKVLADPWNGRKIPLDIGDARWPPEEGWVKMTRKVDGVEIHWNLNTFTGAVEDMKIP